MRRLFAILLLCVLGIFTMPFVASAAGVSPIVNVKYVHDAIRTKWNLDIPYNPNLFSPSAAANMRYVLGMVDRANARFGVETNYGTGEYATSAAANQNTTNRAIETLIQKPIEFPFSMTTTSATKTFSFKISASGTFYVDWGDGSDVDEYVKNDTNEQEISHTYTTAGAYTVRLGGRATGYSEVVSRGAITFGSLRRTGTGMYIQCDLAGIDGSLGAIFPTLADGTQPRFYETFYACNRLSGSIPENLFAGISGAPAEGMFRSTFGGCNGLSGSIPENLFAGISGAPAESMFSSTFYDCINLSGSIPEKLFAGISGAPASDMFSNTFSNCMKLTGSIPEKLFAGISGAPASYMFTDTFHGCEKLTGEIPEKLFAGISGAPAESMFWGTFDGCGGLTGISGSLFAGISGAPAEGMFRGTFWGCTNLTGEIPVGLFGNLSGSSANSMFGSAFSGCSGLTGKSARNPDGTPLYDVFPTATSSEVGNMYAADMCLDDNASIPEAWGKNPDCASAEPEYSFFMTTTPATQTFSFKISASGTFYVDWGDGSDVDEYVKNDTNEQEISHTYTTAGAYTVKLGGLATGYSDSLGSSGAGSAISFYLNDNLAGIDGSLGAIFPTLADGTQPRFASTFFDCRGLTGSIPENLFAGISGAPAESMFGGTFVNCRGLTGSIPENLFAGISGAPASDMFSATFSGCSGLTGSIPDKLFAGISGAPASGMFSATFYGCSGLTGISGSLFAGISGAPAADMFNSTFDGCSGLTGEIPLGLFGNISGAPAEYMFQLTFDGCSGLTGEIPLGLLGNLSGAEADNMFSNMFRDCSGLTGKSARNPDGTPLYEVFPTTNFNAMLMYGGTCLADNASIPEWWGRNASCVYSGPTE